MMQRIMKMYRVWGLAMLAFVSLGVLAACGGDDDGADDAAAAQASAAGESSAAGPAGEGGKLTLVAYSTPKEAYEAVIPGFQGTPAGAGVEFDESYGASGDQSRAIVSGLPADVAAFSLEPDM